MASKHGRIVHVDAGVNWAGIKHCNNCCLQMLCQPFHPYDQSVDNCSHRWQSQHSSPATALVVWVLLWTATAAKAAFVYSYTAIGPIAKSSII